jgi:hypothetical protein
MFLRLLFCIHGAWHSRDTCHPATTFTWAVTTLGGDGRTQRPSPINESRVPSLTRRSARRICCHGASALCSNQRRLQPKDQIEILLLLQRALENVQSTGWHRIWLTLSQLASLRFGVKEWVSLALRLGFSALAEGRDVEVTLGSWAIAEHELNPSLDVVSWVWLRSSATLNSCTDQRVSFNRMMRLMISPCEITLYRRPICSSKNRCGRQRILLRSRMRIMHYLLRSSTRLSHMLPIPSSIRGLDGA